MFTCHNGADFRTYFDEGSDKFNPVAHKFRKDKLDFRVKLPDFQGIKVFGFEFPNHISIIGDHRFQEFVESNFRAKAVVIAEIFELLFRERDAPLNQIMAPVFLGHPLLASRQSVSYGDVHFE